MTKKLDDVRAEVELLRWCKARKKEIADVEATARARVEEALGEDESGTLDDELAITWRHSKRTSLDQKMLAKLWPEAYAECKTTSAVRRFDVF
jgi:predicted phage-related endonuclease